MPTTNKHVSDALNAELTRRGITRTQLARELGMPLPNLLRVLNGRVGKVPGSVQKILDYLDFTLTAVPKDQA